MSVDHAPLTPVAAHVSPIESPLASPFVLKNHAALLRVLDYLKAHNYAFTAVTPLTHSRVNARSENAYAQDLGGIFGWSRLFSAEVAGAELLRLMQAADILEPHDNGWRSRIRVASLGSHMFIHSAFPTVESNAIFFGPDTYRFIAAIERHLQRRTAPIRRAVDIGCGAGPGAIISAKKLPTAEVFAVDINESALQVTQLNAQAAAARNVHVRYSDLLKDTNGLFDFIVANPPYLLDPSQRTYRHGGGALGAGLSEAIVATAIERLSIGGSLMLYTGVAIENGVDPFLAKIKTLVPPNFSCTYQEIDPDIFSEELLQGAYAAVDRIAAITLEVTRR